MLCSRSWAPLKIPAMPCLQRSALCQLPTAPAAAPTGLGICLAPAGLRFGDPCKAVTRSVCPGLFRFSTEDSVPGETPQVWINLDGRSLTMCALSALLLPIAFSWCNSKPPTCFYRPHRNTRRLLDLLQTACKRKLTVVCVSVWRPGEWR